MKMTKILYLLMAAAGIALAFPTPENEPTKVTDIIKRQDPAKFQDMYVDVRVLGGVLVVFHVLWDCVRTRLIEHSIGTGHVHTIILRNPHDGSYLFQMEFGATGGGTLPARSQHNPGNVDLPFHFNGQDVRIDFGAYDDADDNTVVVEPGTWVNPATENIGPLTVTNQLTGERTRATIERLHVSQPFRGDENHPPESDGSGLDSDSDASSTISFTDDDG